MNREVSIGNRKIGDGYPAYIIGEIGINHNGDIDVAKKLMEVAKNAGADAVKFQTYKPESVYVPNAGQSGYLSEAGINEDIRDISRKPCGRILATFTKEANQNFYQRITYTAKDIDISFILTHNCIKDIVII